MNEIAFDPGASLIFVIGSILGPRESTDIRLVLDTGASQTIVRPEILDMLGYSARDGDRMASVSSPIGREFGYTIRLRRFECLGFSFEDFSVLAMDVTDSDEIDGLPGLNFLKAFDYQICSKKGLIRIARA